MSVPSGTRPFPLNLVMTHSSFLQQMYLAAGHITTFRKLLSVEQEAKASIFNALKSIYIKINVCGYNYPIFHCQGS